MQKSVGFDRKIDLEWLDAVAGQVASGASEVATREYLKKMLEGVLAGEAHNSARGKTITVLLHTWSRVSPQSISLREQAAELLASVPAEQRLALHWAMLLSAYPFFFEIATMSGRLVTLNDTVALSQLKSRLIETWGERSTLIRASQRVLGSMVQWGALRNTTTRSVYQPKAKLPLPAEISLLMMEAVLHNLPDHTMSFGRLLEHPALFPFQLSLSSQQLKQSPKFATFRQGFDGEVVGLVKTVVPATPQASLQL